jgi:hypothetical protein
MGVRGRTTPRARTTEELILQGTEGRDYSFGARPRTGRGFLAAATAAGFNAAERRAEEGRGIRARAAETAQAEADRAFGLAQERVGAQRLTAETGAQRLGFDIQKELSAPSATEKFGYKIPTTEPDPLNPTQMVSKPGQIKIGDRTLDVTQEQHEALVPEVEARSVEAQTAMEERLGRNLSDAERLDLLTSLYQNAYLNRYMPRGAV